MGFQEAITSCFSQYVGFQGRAARPEYWFWVLFCVIVSVVFKALGMVIGDAAAILSGLFSLATLLPGLAVGARRLHDTDRSGWLLLLALIPVVGWLILLYFFVQPGTQGPNKFGV